MLLFKRSDTGAQLDSLDQLVGSTLLVEKKSDQVLRKVMFHQFNREIKRDGCSFHYRTPKINTVAA